MARQTHGLAPRLRGYFRRFELIPPEETIQMPQSLIVIFLLFIAVLAFGWFYWQRAKARTVTTTAVDETPVEAPHEPTDSPS